MLGDCPRSTNGPVMRAIAQSAMTAIASAAVDTPRIRKRIAAHTRRSTVAYASGSDQTWNASTAATITATPSTTASVS